MRGPPSSKRRPKRPINAASAATTSRRQHLGGKLVEQAAAGHLALVEYRALVALEQQVPGGRQARGTATDDRHAPACGRCLSGR